MSNDSRHLSGISVLELQCTWHYSRMCRSPRLISPFVLTAALAYIMRLRTKTIAEGARGDMDGTGFDGLVDGL